MDHDKHSTSSFKEYVKFIAIMILIVVVAAIAASWPAFDLKKYLASFMGVFFIVFAGFKLINLKEFAYGFQSYDIIAKKSLAYAFIYPYIQLIFGILYLTNHESTPLNSIVLIVSIISSIGVFKALNKKQEVQCVCLGNVIKLPLSTVSLVEDIGMAAMAIAMIFMK